MILRGLAGRLPPPGSAETVASPRAEERTCRTGPNGSIPETRPGRGKLVGGERLLASWDQTLLDLQATPLGIDHGGAIQAGGLPWAHRDPVDRMLVAQATRHNVPLVTRGEVILGAGVTPTIDTGS